jgi:hypothetical protein
MPLLNIKDLNLSDSPETVAFEAVEKILRTDPDVKRLFKSIYSWQGDALDDAQPTYDACPWLRITPAPETSDWTNVGQHKMPMSVAIEIAVQGTRVRNLMNAFSVIRAAIFPAPGSDRFNVVEAAIGNTAITKVRFTRPAYGTAKDQATSAKMLVGMGGLELNLNVNT